MLKKRKGSQFYWFRFKLKGRTFEGSTHLTNKKAAGDVERAARLQAVQELTGTLPPDTREPSPMFEAWAAEYLDRYKVLADRTGRRATYHTNRAIIRRLTKAFKGQRLVSISAPAVLEYQTSRMKAPNGRGGLVSNHTINIELAVLRALFKAAIESKRFTYIENPTLGLKMLAARPKQRRVTDTELAAYFEALKGVSVTAHDIEKVMALQGCRNHEVTGLRCQDVDFGLNVIRVANAERNSLVVVHGKTAGSRRELYMHPDVRAILYARAEAAAFARDAFLFPSRYVNARAGKQTTNFESAHRRALAASGVAPFVSYDLRHYFATTALEKHKVDIETVSKLLGHSNLTTTMRYLHTNEQAKRAAMIAISGGVDAGAAGTDTPVSPAPVPVIDSPRESEAA